MSEINIAWGLTLATIWTVVMMPMIVIGSVLKFMDIMRRRKDSLPW